MREGRDRYDCAECKNPFVLVYEEAAGTEARELTPVACPHCGGVNYVSVARSAAYALTYQALVEKRDPYECWGCRRRFVVVYETEPTEAGHDDRGLSLLRLGKLRLGGAQRRGQARCVSHGEGAGERWRNVMSAGVAGAASSSW